MAFNTSPNRIREIDKNPKCLGDISLYTKTEGTTSTVFLEIDTNTIRMKWTSISKILLNYKPYHKNLMVHAKTKPELSLALTTTRQEEPFFITQNDVLNHAAIREVKQKADDLLNSLMQIGFQVYCSGSLGVDKTDTVIVSRVISGPYVVTRVSGPSENERLLWARVIHASKLYMAIHLEEVDDTLDKVVLEMNNGDGPSSQLPDDVLEFSEVSKVAHNTEITHQVDFSTNAHYEAGSLLQDITSTEPPASLAELSERNIRIIDNNLEFSITNEPNDLIYELDLPSGLYRFLDTSISTALQVYTLIKCDVEITVKVNANQAQCGRYVLAHWPNFDQMNNMEFDNVYRMLQRDHAIIDLSVSNDIVYTAKYENLRSYVAIQADEIGQLKGGNFGRMSLRCLSPLRIADTGNPRCPFQIFARLVNVKMVGMRHPLPPDTTLRLRNINNVPQLEMDLQTFNNRFDTTVKSVNSVINAIPVVGPINKLIGNIFGNGSIAIAKLFGVNMDRIKAVESRLIYMGMINKDRPVDISHPAPLLPQPIHSYSYGRGPYVSKKMRLEPEATTPHFGEHCTVETPESILELAQVPGLCAKFQITSTMNQGDLLIELPVLPYDPRYRAQYPIVPHVPFPNAGGQSRGFAHQLSPVAYFSQMYTYYSGSIVYDFLPVKTTSHNFTMQAAFVPFDGAQGTTTDEQMQSCKWKAIDFRTAQTSSFTVPWISPVMMRTYPRPDSAVQSVPNNMWNQLTNESAASMKDPGKIVVRLVNPLNQTPIVSPVIDVLVFNRAHTNLRFLHPKPHNHAAVMPPQQWSNTFNLDNSGLTAVRANGVIGKISGAPLARLEMATGEVQKGDEQSPVEDPLIPASGPYVQSLENHTNILDVCRRFEYHTTVTGMRSSNVAAGNLASAMPFATFPVNVFGIPTGGEPVLTLSAPLPDQPLASFRDGVASCFRYSRGSMNLACHVLNDHPVEVDFYPPIPVSHLMTGGLGDVLTTFSEATTRVLIPSLPTNRGIAHEIIDPRLNPLQTIEIPFYNPNIYNDIQGLLANVATWNPTTPIPGGFVRRQDKSDLDSMSLTMGQLTIRQLNYDFTNAPTVAAASFKVRVSSALGDDFRFYHFMGVPPMYYNPTTTWTMESGGTLRTLSQDEIDTELLKAGIESNPGPGFFSKGCSVLKEYNPFSNTAAIIGELRDFVKAPGSIARDINELKSTSVTAISTLQNILAMYATGLDLLDITTLASALLAALQKNATWYSIVTAFLIIIKVTGLFTAESISCAATKLLATALTTFDTPKCEAPFAIENDGTLVAAVLTSLLIEGSATYLNSSSKAVNQEFVTTAMLRFFTNFNFMRAGAICIFFTRFSAAIAWLWKRSRQWIYGLNNYNLLSDPKFIQSFMEDYSFVVNEMNLSSIHMISSYRQRYWSTVIAAYYLKGVLATINDPKMRNSALLSAVNEVIKKSNDIKSHISAPPVRYEPFSYWLYGTAGTGKTCLSLDLSIDMAKQIGHVYNADPVYTRSPHSMFWNGYDGQPIITIDDANGVTEPTILGRMVSEFQALKTSAKMRIEMPRLEEKNAEILSTILAVCSNVFSWKSTMIVDKEAFYRRRDFVCKVTWSNRAEAYFKTNNITTKIASALPEEMTKDFDHLYFHVHQSPSDADTSVGMKFSKFKETLLERHRDYHSKEMNKMYDRYQKSLSLAKESANHIVDRTSMSVALTSTILGCESTEVVSETIKKSLFDLKQRLPEQFKILPSHTQYMLDKMKNNPPQLEIMIDSSYTGMYKECSPFVKEKFFPNYTDSHSILRDKITPWVSEDQRKMYFEDNLSSECTSCRSLCAPGVRYPKYICALSTEGHQHWVCNTCAVGFERAGSLLCPVCRSEYFIKLSDQEIAWNAYKKMSYLIQTASDIVMKPIKSTFKYIWDNAFWITYVFGYLALVSTFGYVVYDEISTEARRHEDLDQFVKDWGVIPDKFGETTSGMVFSIQNHAYHKDASGSYVRVTPRCEMNEPPVALETLPSTSKETPIVYHSCTQSDDDGEPSMAPPFGLNDLDHIECNEEHQGEGIKKVYSIMLKLYSNKSPTIAVNDGKECYSFLDEDAYPHQVIIARCGNPHCLLNEINKQVLDGFIKRDIIGPYSEHSKKIRDDIDNYPLCIRSYACPMINVDAIPTRFERFCTYQKQLYEHLRGRLVHWFEKIYETVCNQWKWIVAAAACFVSVFLGYSFVYSDEQDPVLESPHAGAKYNHNAPRTLTLKAHGIRGTPRLETNFLQVAVPPQVEAVMNLVEKQKIAIASGDKVGYGIVLCSGYALVPRHTIHTIYKCQERGQTVTITLKDGTLFQVKQSLGLHIFCDFPEREFTVIQHSRLIGKDIRKHILAPETEDVTYSPFAYVHDIEDGNNVPVKIDGVFNLTEDSVEPIPLHTKIKGEDFEYVARFYDFVTAVGVQGFGKCGSIMFNPQGKIIGLHVAGVKRSMPSRGIGYYPVLYKEFFDTIPDALNQPPKVELEMRAYLPNLNYSYSMKRAPYHSEVSKIIPSAIASQAWESITQPCIQSHKDPRYIHGGTPLIDGASTIGAPTEDPDIVLLQASVEALVGELLPKMPPPSMKVPTTVREAVTSENHIHVEPMKLNTSAGLPLIVDHPGKNLKSDFIVHEIVDQKHHVYFKNNFSSVFWEKHNARKNGVPPREPFWAHLKDERRKVPKLTSFGGTRVFSVAPLELVLTSRMLLLPFMDAFHTDPVGLHHGIGLAPDSPMWTDFVEYHRSKGDCLVQLDFSKFSDSMPWLFVDGAFAVVKSYYMKHNILNSEVENMLDTLRYEITRSRVCVGLHVFELKNGTLQGHPITSLINSLVNMLEQVYVWCVITNMPASDFFQRCSLTVMGDDVVIAVPRNLINIYNGQLIAKAFMTMKIQVTDENKDSSKVKKFQPFNELCFMGRSFQLHPYRNVYLAPADLESIFDTPLWIQKKDNRHFDATQENIGQSLSLMYGHGPLVYEMYRSVLQFLCNDVVLRSWYELDYLFMKNVGFVSCSPSPTLDCSGGQYYSKAFLGATDLIVPNVDYYMCRCRFNCEQELIDRIKCCTKQELRTFLPFVNQSEGCAKMGSRLVIRLPIGFKSCASSLVVDLVAPDIRTLEKDPDDSGVLYLSNERMHSALVMDIDNV